MNATITTNGKEINGKNIQDLRSQLNRMLSVDGFQGLTAITENGTKIHVELYEGQDYVRTANGRLLNK